MAPLDNFVKLHATNGILVLPEYTVALCSAGTWPFLSTMDINILPEACLAYDTPANSENAPDDPIITGTDTNVEPGKKQCRHKGKSKSQSKSAGANSSGSEASPGYKNRNPQINEALAKEVLQDLHLSSDGSDSEIPEDAKDTWPNGDPQPPDRLARIESRLDPPGVPEHAPSTPAPQPSQPTEALSTGENTTTTPGEEGVAGNKPAPPATPVTMPAMPSKPDRAKPQPTVSPTVSRADTTSPSPVPTRPTASPGFAGVGMTTNPGAIPQVPPSLVPAGPDPSALIVKRLMTELAQSQAVTQARGNPNARAFSSVMTRLRQACGIMMEGFREACLGVEVVVQKALLTSDCT